MKDNDDEALLQFRFPAKVDIGKMNKEERMNIFRGFFATSRYNRLLIQKLLVKCSLDNSLYDKVIELEANHNRNYLETQKMIECYGYMEEFVATLLTTEETAHYVLQSVLRS